MRSTPGRRSIASSPSSAIPERPLALAVVPAQATAALAARLVVLPTSRASTCCSMAMPTPIMWLPPDKKIEVGVQRPAMLTLGELATGWMALERLFGPRALPVMVPPWNRIAPVLVPTLPEIGYRGPSTFGPRLRVHPVRGLLQVNTHVDLIDWKGGRASRARRSRPCRPRDGARAARAAVAANRSVSSVIILRWTPGRGIS